MGSLESDKIAEVENTVREKFTIFMEDEAFKSSVLEWVDAVNVFGFYGRVNIGQFAFFPGHKIEMEKLALEVKSHAKDYYNIPADYKVPRKNVVRSPIGYLFGTKTRNWMLGNYNVTKPNSTHVESMEADNFSTELVMTNEMVPKHSHSDEHPENPVIDAKSKLLHLVNTILQPFHAIATEQHINFKNDGTKVVGLVTCQVCAMTNKEKQICIQYEKSHTNSCYYWSTSNFIKHMNKHRTSAQTNDNRESKKRAKPGQSEIIEGELIQEEKDATECIDHESIKEEVPFDLSKGVVSQPTIIPITQDYFTELIMNQIKTQNEWLNEIMKSYKSSSLEAMEFKLNTHDRLIEIIKIKKDSNCLFSSLCHQIFGYSPGSKEHEKVTKELRNDVVKHIDGNFDSFKFQLIGRLYEKGDRNEFVLDDNMDKQARDFVKNELRKASTWGGGESIKAVSEIHKVNIIVFPEKDTCRSLFDFNPKYHRTLAISHRLNDLPNKLYDHRNHYESVSKISQHILFDISVALSKIEINKHASKDAAKMIIGLFK